ncbi:hypothetical protein [Saccharopolyspora gloriosae]|uniref:hypothetical protein n=1 Tax=Saccharopolyspora gloriosae TaxID=455344 RepID=UPI001FB860BA|nr:hypothetical protein [Saccharopolyspora gloriosae]
MSKSRVHEVVATVPPDRLVVELVRHVADAVGGQAAYCVPVDGDPTRLRVVAAAPEHVLVHGGLPGESAREPVRGGGLLLVAEGRRRLLGGEPNAVRDAASWLGIVTEVERARGDRDRAEARARGLRAEVATARERLAQVRDLERRRLVRAITTTTLRDLEDLRRRISELAEVSAEDALLTQLAELGDAVDELLDGFRAIVRGVYPAMLPDHGPRAALEELAATLPRPVRFGGELGRRASWEVESGFYHAVAAVLNLPVVEETGSDSAVAVEFRRDEAMHARVSSAAGSLSTGDLRAALDHDAARIVAVGGTMDCAVIDGTAVVTVSLADRTVRAVPSFRSQGGALHQWMLDLVRQGRHAFGGSDRYRWDAVEARLTRSPRLAVVSDAPVDPAAVARASRLGITVVLAGGPADEALAERFLRDGDQDGSIDAVFTRVPPTSAFLMALRRSRQRVEVNREPDLDAVASRLIERAPVIAARRALVAVRALVSELPGQHPLRWAVDQLATEAHEIAELDLLDAILAGDVRFRDGVAEDAARLLGARGTDPRSRLGLPAESDDERLRAAAQHAVSRWREQARRPGLGGRNEVTCEALVRTAEGLLNAARTP